MDETELLVTVNPATTEFASVERCSAPEAARFHKARHHVACQRGAVFSTRIGLHEKNPATTELASVERCSQPEAARFQKARHHALVVYSPTVPTNPPN